MNAPLRMAARTLICGTLIVLAGCASRGGYYKNDGPGARIPANIAAIPNATPRIEHPAAANFRPYSVFGVRYVPIAENQPYRKEGIASWYGRKFHGEKTANGETYDMYAMTAAHATLPLPSYARVTNVSNGRSIIVRINDRGPFHTGRIIDLSYVAAAKLGLIGPGSGEVIVQAITNNDIRSGRYQDENRLAQATAPKANPPKTSERQAAEPKTAEPPAGRETTRVAAADRTQDAPPQAPPALDPVQATLGTLSAQASPPREEAGRAKMAPAGSIYLQFGAFASADNAQALAQRINTEAAGLAAPAEVNYQPPLYKVRTGPFASRTAADATAARLAESANLNPIIAQDQGL